jgi:hypothetical protein
MIVLRLLVFLTMLGVLLFLLSLGYDAVTAASVLIVLVGVAVRATIRLLGEMRLHAAAG